ncbi:MAG: 5'-nucleotidase C-terminal domain-containing protein [Comamonadaceae bacterium]|nr:5'-nucleotidase C-terminal domain-containing protein [Comamonadaceae bacterium]
MNLRALLISTATLVLLLAGCGSDSSNESTPLELTIVHINDHHSNLDPFSDQVMRIDGVDTQLELGGFSRIVSAFKPYQERDDVLKLHAGDAITGTPYYSLFKGKADADMMNSICFDAMTVGNHEFDEGDEQLRNFIDHLHAGPCQTPVLTANVHPQVGTALAPRAEHDFLQPYIVKTIRGVQVGVIGITVKDRTQNSSSPLPSTLFDDEATAAQRTIDQLKAQSVRHIVLMTHQGYDADLALAAKLTDVDVIIGGDSHTLLGDFSAQDIGHQASGPYPTVVNNLDGKPVCIGQAWEFSKAIGEMRVTFNQQGEVTSCKGQTSIVVGDSFKRKDAGGAWRSVDATTSEQIAKAAASKGLKVLEGDRQADGVLSTYASQIDALKKQPLGSASEPLCLVRTPGEYPNMSAGVPGCEGANELARGSDITQVVMQSFLKASPRADIALHGAGGTRRPVPEGVITMGDAFTVLPFSSMLIELPVTGQQLATVLEEAVSAYLDIGLPSGAGHPYAAGLRWHLDMSQPKGHRFTKLEAKDRNTGTWSPLDHARTYIVVTDEFIARGQDGYASFKPIYDSGNFTNSYKVYAQAFVDYVNSKQTVHRPSPEDYSHQAVTTRSGSLLLSTNLR